MRRFRVTSSMRAEDKRLIPCFPSYFTRAAEISILIHGTLRWWCCLLVNLLIAPLVTFDTERLPQK